MKESISAIKRISSAIVLLPVYLLFMWYSGFEYLPVFVLSSIVSLSCLYEFYSIVSATEQGKPFAIPGIAAAFFVNVIVYLYAFGKVVGAPSSLPEFDARWFFALIVVFISGIAAIQIFTRPIKGGIYSISVTIFGVVYIAFFFSHMILIRSLSHGFIYLLILHIIVMINDSLAYFGGVLFGRHKTGLAVSPNKSWEGYCAGVLFSIIAVLVANEFFSIFYDLRLFGTVEAAFVGIFFAIAGDIGDLIESAVKRDGKVKDSGRLIPGHGGMWDVFDALVFTMPLFYYYLKIKGIQ